MCALANVFESAGLATVGLSLVRRQAQNGRAPRMLHCQFPLGRPLGIPNDATFQHDVLRRAFALLGRGDTPVLEDHPVVIDDDSGIAAACPLPPTGDLEGPAPVVEARGLRAAYDRSLAARDGRTLVGRVTDADGIPALVGTLVRLADGATLDDVGWKGHTLIAASQDLRAYYEEAALALTDDRGARRIETWFFEETEAGRLVRRVQSTLDAAGVNPGVTGYLLPGTQR